jgi:hypothetical protein
VIRHLDQLLRDLFVTSMVELGDESQVGFRPPDDDWIAYVNSLTVAGAPANALNVYLIELRENRVLRSNEVLRVVNGGAVSETQAPMRLDCHYLITAWSPASVTPALEPAWDEHALLYDAAAVLALHDPIVPEEIYGPSGLGLWPVGFPPELQDAELPIAFVPMEGFPKYAEFWGTMGTAHRWRPAIHLAITLPIIRAERSAGAEVTTRILDMRIGDPAASAGVVLRIGGHVRDAAAPQADGSPSLVAEGWVMLETLAGKRMALVRTDAQGRFQLGGLQPGTYRLRARTIGHADVIRDVAVPSETGEYDLLFE